MSATGLREHKDRIGLAIALLITLAILPYLQTLGHDFVNYDDNLYVSENPHVQQGLTFHSIAWAFTTAKGGNWHPVNLGLAHGRYQLCGVANPPVIISQI